jgi:hypothetical protein
VARHSGTIRCRPTYSALDRSLDLCAVVSEVLGSDRVDQTTIRPTPGAPDARHALERIRDRRLSRDRLDLSRRTADSIAGLLRAGHAESAKEPIATLKTSGQNGNEQNASRGDDGEDTPTAGDEPHTPSKRKLRRQPFRASHHSPHHTCGANARRFHQLGPSSSGSDDAVDNIDGAARPDR